MNFKQLEAFYWLTRLKSYQRVADHINLTQPAVSVRVVGLEESLGVKLVESHAPNFKLTQKGLEAAEFAEAFMNLQERMVTGLKEDAAKPLCVGLVEPVMLTWGPDFLRSARERTDSQVSLSTGSNYDLRQLVSEGSLDIVFATASMGAPTLGDSFRVRYRTGWVAHPDLVPRSDGPLRKSDLARLDLVFFARMTQQSSPSIESVAEVRSAAVNESTSTSFTGTCELVRRGLGVSPLALAPLAREIEQGDLVELNVEEPLPALEVRCVYLNRSRRRLARQYYNAAAEAAKGWCASFSDYASFHAE